MGFFRKEKSYEATSFSKPGSRRSWKAAKRYIKKLAAFATLTAVFGIVYSQNTQEILDLAWRDQISWGTAFSQSLIKAMQYGTLKTPELPMHAVEMLLHASVFTALIEGVIPLSVYFMSQFYLVSFLLDIWDGHEGEVFRSRGPVPVRASHQVSYLLGNGSSLRATGCCSSSRLAGGVAGATADRTLSAILVP